MDKEKEQKKEEIKPEEKKIPEQAINTFKKGMTQAIEGKQGIAVKMAIANAKKEEEEKEQIEKLRLKNIFLITVGLIFIAAGFVIFFVAIKPIKNTKLDIQTLEVKFGTVYSKIDITKMSKIQLIRAIEEEASKPFSGGYVKSIYTTEQIGLSEKIIPFSRFLEILQTNHPLRLVKNILSENFTYNIYRKDGINYPFLIVKANSGTNALKEMGEWEKDLFLDMSEIMMIENTLPENKDLKLKTFSDIVIKNYLIRTILNDSKKPTLSYTLLNDQTLVITNNEQIIPDIVDWIYAPSIRN